MNKIISGIFLSISFLGSAQKSEYLYIIKFLKCCDELTHHDPNWKLKNDRTRIVKKLGELSAKEIEAVKAVIMETYVA